jgi:hypothetical protein
VYRDDEDEPVFSMEERAEHELDRYYCSDEGVYETEEGENE